MLFVCCFLPRSLGRATAHNARRGTVALRGGGADQHARGAESAESEQPSVSLIQALQAEIQSNITAAATQLQIALRAELSADLAAELAAFKSASAQQRGEILSTAQAQFEELQAHRRSIDNATTYAALQSGAAAAINATQTDVAKISRNKELNASAANVLVAVQSTAGIWKTARDEASAAAVQSVAAWNSASGPLNTTYMAIVGGLGRLNDASDAVVRASRAVHWDEQASRFAADDAEATRIQAQSANAFVQQAEEQALEATSAVKANRAALEILTGTVDNAVQQGAAAVATVNAAQR